MKRKTLVIIFVVLVLVALAAILGFTNFGKDIRARITNSQIDSYTACGCGACGGTTPQDQVIHSREDFDKIKSDDLAIKNGNPAGQCAVMGCSICIHYILKP